MQVFNDMRMLAAVEDGQGPRVALVPHIGICWIDGDSSQVHHKVASKDGPHASIASRHPVVRQEGNKDPKANHREEEVEQPGHNLERVGRPAPSIPSRALALQFWGRPTVL